MIPLYEYTLFLEYFIGYFAKIFPILMEHECSLPYSQKLVIRSYTELIESGCYRRKLMNEMDRQCTTNGSEEECEKDKSLKKIRLLGIFRRRSDFDSGHYQIFREEVGLERGPLSLVSTIEELLGRKSSGSG
jgi:hypothetical protein